MTGKNLKDKLVLAHVKQVELANMLGVSKQSLSNILNSDSHVNSELLERICVALNLDMSFFYPAKPVTETTTNVSRTKAHNLHTGSGNITENAGSSDALTLALQQNAELIALLRAKEGI